MWSCDATMSWVYAYRVLEYTVHNLLWRQFRQRKNLQYCTPSTSSKEDLQLTRWSTRYLVSHLNAWGCCDVQGCKVEIRTAVVQQGQLMVVLRLLLRLSVETMEQQSNDGVLILRAMDLRHACLVLLVRFWVDAELELLISECTGKYSQSLLPKEVLIHPIPDTKFAYQDFDTDSQKGDILAQHTSFTAMEAGVSLELYLTIVSRSWLFDNGLKRALSSYFGPACFPVLCVTHHRAFQFWNY